MTLTRRGWAVAWCLVACSSDDAAPSATSTVDDSGHTRTDTTASTSPTTPVRVLSAECSLSAENALRFSCEVELDGEDIACVRATPVGESSRDWCSRTRATTHNVAVSLLPEAHDVDWFAYASTSSDPTVSGSLTTSELPPEVAFDVVSTSGSPENATWITGYMGCDQQLVVVLDEQRRVVWYERIPGLNAHRWTEDHELLSLARHRDIVRRGLDGIPTWSYVEPNPDVALHHDVFLWNDWVFALHARLDDTLSSVITDGVTVIDPDGTRHDRWELADWIAPTNTPPPFIAAYWFGNFPFGSIDWYHTNGMTMTAQGELVVSARHQSTVIAMRGDPSQQDAGEVLWHIVGSERSQIPEGYSLQAEGAIAPAFSGQHYPSLVHDEAGALLIFDNLGQDTSRALELDVDRDLQTATVTAQWSLPTVCETQGSVSNIHGESFLIACGRTWYEANRSEGVKASQTPQCRDPKQKAMMRGRIAPWTPPTP